MRPPNRRAFQFPAISGSDCAPFALTYLRSSVATLLLCPGIAFAQDVTLPEAGTVTSGSAAITQPGTGQMVILQDSSQAVLNWDSFSVGQDAHVDFRLPTGEGATLNRVTGSTQSDIHGRLTSNGTLHLVNPNGIFIGPTGTVDAGSFSASTLDMSNEDFKAGRLVYSGNGASGTVTNAGRVTIGRGGYAALLGGKVRNSGIVTVPFGRIGLAAGEWVTLDVSGDQFLQVGVPSKLDDDETLIENSGTLSAEAGLIEMRAATARNAARNAINLSGVAEATSVSMRNGRIVLGGGDGGRVRVSGRVSTRSTAQAVPTSTRPAIRGGSVDITGTDIALEGATIDASGASGGGLVRIGGDFGGQGDLQRAETLFVTAETQILADALEAGDGGRIALWSDLNTDFAGFLSARGGKAGGNGGFAEVSSAATLRYTGLADMRAAAGRWGALLLDPTDIIIDQAQATALSDTLETATVTLNTVSDDGDAGNIAINSGLSWGSATTLALIAEGDVSIGADVIAPNGDLSITVDGGDVNFGAASRVEVANLTARGQTPIIIIQEPSFNGGTGPTLALESGSELDVGTLSFEDWGSVVANGSIAAVGTFGIDAQHVTADGPIDVGSFTLSSGEWVQIAPLLPNFQADDFTIEPDAIFTRALGGVGSAGNPYLIADVYGLQGMRFVDSGAYALANDINAAQADSWSGGFDPLALSSGSFDGQGFTISNLTVVKDPLDLDSSSGNDAALFSTIAAGGAVSDLTLSGANMDGSAAAILAITNAGSVTNVEVDGTVSSNGGTAAGLVAVNSGSIADAQAEIVVTAADGAAGGLIGTNSGSIQRSAVEGTVTSNGGEAAGGMVAFNQGTIQDSLANVTVTLDNSGASNPVPTDDTYYAGGFVGKNTGTIQTSGSEGSVTLSNSLTSADFDSSATGINLAVGGFAGAEGEPPNAPPRLITITDSFANGNITVASGSDPLVGIFAGGFVGTLNGRVERSFSTGTVTTPAPPGFSNVNRAGFAGIVIPGSTLSGNFWDTTTSEIIEESDVATGLTTAQLQDTAGFIALASAQGWDFANVWAPGDATQSLYPSQYAVKRRIFVTPDTTPLSVQYGLTDMAIASGQISGGPSVYRFDQSDELVPDADIFSDLTFSDITVGSQSFSLDTTEWVSATGTEFTVIALDGSAQITPAPLTITATDRTRSVGFDFNPSDPEFEVDNSQLFFGDGVTSIMLDSGALDPDAGPGAYLVTASDAMGPGLENYDITYATGTLTVEAPLPSGDDGASEFGTTTLGQNTLPNPTDTIDLTIGETFAALDLNPGALARAERTLAEAEAIGDSLELAANSCANSAADVTRYLACLSDALSAFANELDVISTDLPPGLQNVARIVQNARSRIDQARRRAQDRLAGATTDADRAAIRQDAIAEAADALTEASGEIRKAIALIRTEDPELAAVQRATVNTIAGSVDTVRVRLTRTTEL